MITPLRVPGGVAEAASWLVAAPQVIKAEKDPAGDACPCPLLGVKRTSLISTFMSANDPKRTWGSSLAQLAAERAKKIVSALSSISL